MTDTEAAVLIPIRERDGTDAVGFVVVSDDAPNHPGHVAFPGGTRDVSDRSLRETALREADEEAEIDPESVTVGRRLPFHETRNSGFRVAPFVGRVPPTTDLVPDGFETVDGFWIPVPDLLDRFRNGEDGPVYPRDEDPDVWGVTARILTTYLAWERGLDE